MKSFALPHFGEISLESFEGYYDVDIDYKNRKIQLDLNFQKDKIEIYRLNKLKEIIEDLIFYDPKIEMFIDRDYKDQTGTSIIRDYVNFQFEELEKELNELIQTGDSEPEKKLKLKRKLNVKRIGFYPDEDDSFAVFDYEIGKDISDDLIVVKINFDGSPTHISWES